jgi:hypothetical protein
MRSAARSPGRPGAERAAGEQVAAARQDRDDAVRGAESRAAQAAEAARAEDAEAEVQLPRADREKAAGQTARRQPISTTRSSRRSRRR